MISSSLLEGIRRNSALFCFGLMLAFCLLPGYKVLLAQQNPPRQVPVESLIYDLQNPDPVRRKEAAILLGNNKLQRATPDLVAAANDKDPAVRREIVIALHKMADIRALPAFIELTADPEKDIRDKCIQGIVSLYLPKEGGLGVTLNKVANFLNPWSDEWEDTIVEAGTEIDPKTVTALQERLKDSDEAIRARAARALGILRGKVALPGLIETLRQDNSNPVRFETIRALRKISDLSTGKELIPYISFSDSRIRNEAVFTLGRFRYREAASELMRAYETESALPPKKQDKNYHAMLLDALAFIGDASSEDLFTKETKSQNEVIRLHAYEGLARIGNPKMVTDLSRDRLNEKDPKIRIAQAYALFLMGRREYLDEIVKALDNRKTNNEARQYLVELRPEDLSDLYSETKFKEVSIREGLAEIMGIIGDNKAVPVLQEMSNDHRGQITALCNQALRRIAARTGS
jgi:HEAT repeat protein